jgi:hypothetical protein
MHKPSGVFSAREPAIEIVGQALKHSPARFNMKMTFSPNVLLLFKRLINTINTRFSFLASSACNWSSSADPVFDRW